MGVGKLRGIAMASIFAKRGILHLSYFITDYKGDKHRKTENLRLKDTRNNRRLAERVKDEKEFELNRPIQKVLKHHLTLEEGERLFLIYKKDTAPNTKVNYRNMFKHFSAIVPKNIPVSKIVKVDVENLKYYMKDELGLKHNTIASYIKDLKTFWNWMLREKFIAENIVDRIPLKDNPIVVIPTETFEKILEIFKNRNMKHYNFLMFLKLTGFRVSEAVNLQWVDVNFITNRIEVKNLKGKRIEQFPLYPRVKSLLNSFSRDDEHIFDFKNKDSLKFWTREMKKLNYPFTLHSIRKTFATDLINGNVTVFDAMKLLRHRNITTTMKYYTFTDLNRIGNEAEKIFSKKDRDYS